MKDWKKWITRSLQLSEAAERAGMSKEAYMQIEAINAQTNCALDIQAINSRRLDQTIKTMKKELTAREQLSESREIGRQIRVLSETGGILAGQRRA